VKLEIAIQEQLGGHLADGAKAAEFRMTQIEPYLDICPQIILDFTGVRNANSSFINALVAGLIEQHTVKVLQKIVFKGCNPSIQVLVHAAVELGVQKTAGRVNA
jgi:hypothetical protein